MAVTNPRLRVCAETAADVGGAEVVLVPAPVVEEALEVTGVVAVVEWVVDGVVTGVVEGVVMGVEAPVVVPVEVVLPGVLPVEELLLPEPVRQEVVPV